MLWTTFCDKNVQQSTSKLFLLSGLIKVHAPYEEFYSLKVLLLKLIKQNIGFAAISCIILSHILHWISARIPPGLTGKDGLDQNMHSFCLILFSEKGGGCCRGPLVWSISLDLWFCGKVLAQITEEAFTNAYYSLFRYKYHSRKMT